jgi:membrane-bound metal-dependent hydrolase YbcI (DUF457 family)
VTLFEHALIGIDGALAMGLQRRHGWQIVALAGIAAVLPDIDGLSILFGAQCYAGGHRVWGHNLLVTGLLAGVVSAAVYYSDVLARAQRRLGRHVQALSISNAERVPERCSADLLLWIAVGVAAAYSHLLADIVFSAGKDLPVWGVPLLWPFSAKEWAFPLLPWGDIGATLILATGMLAMLRWSEHARLIAAESLLATAAYLAARGLFD